MQSRLRGLHHVDVPWRPCDLEQREGRIIRQGNQNEVVDIVNYVTEGTYDVVMWQKVQAKALFIEQMRRDEVLDTEIEDLTAAKSDPRPPKPRRSPPATPATCGRSNSTTTSNASPPWSGHIVRRCVNATGG